MQCRCRPAGCRRRHRVTPTEHVPRRLPCTTNNNQTWLPQSFSRTDTCRCAFSDVELNREVRALLLRHLVDNRLDVVDGGTPDLGLNADVLVGQHPVSGVKNNPAFSATQFLFDRSRGGDSKLGTVPCLGVLERQLVRRPLLCIITELRQNLLRMLLCRLVIGAPLLLFSGIGARDAPLGFLLEHIRNKW